MRRENWGVLGTVDLAAVPPQQSTELVLPAMVLELLESASNLTSVYTMWWSLLHHS